MTYYIDFDNTLFNTVEFYNDMCLIMEKFGITDLMINEYENTIDPRLFNPLKLVDYCIKKYQINKRVLEKVKLFFKNANNYLYNDSYDFLIKIKEKGHRLVLLTYGDYEYQNFKIINSGLIKYFDEVIITEYDKDTLELDFNNSIFVDDNPKVIRELLSKNPFKVIRIKRPNNKYSKEIINNSLVEEFINLNNIFEK